MDNDTIAHNLAMGIINDDENRFNEALEEFKSLKHAGDKFDALSSERGYVPLLAIEMGRLDILSVLHKAGADLQRAPSHAHKPLLIEAIDHFRRIDHGDTEGQQAARDIIVFFAETLKADFTATYETNTPRTALGQIINPFLPDLLGLLRRLDSYNGNWTGGWSGKSDDSAPIVMAVSNNMMDVVGFLIEEKEVDLDLNLRNGGTLAHCCGSVEMADVLHQAGLDFAAVASEGYTPAEHFRWAIEQYGSDDPAADDALIAHMEDLASRPKRGVWKEERAALIGDPGDFDPEFKDWPGPA